MTPASRRSPALRVVPTRGEPVDDKLLASLWHEAADAEAPNADFAAAPDDCRAAAPEPDSAGSAADAEPPLRPLTLDAEALAALVERIVDRDEHALGALYDATSGRVHGLVLRIVRRSALAEEVVEDTFWQVWRQAPRYDAGRGRVLTWLLAMARSRAIDALRRDQRYAHVPLPDDGDLVDSDGSSAPMHELLAARRGADQVQRALAALEPRTRQLVAMAFFRGLTHDEIAAQMAMPLGTVKSLIRRALHQLRRLLEPASAG